MPDHTVDPAAAVLGAAAAVRGRRAGDLTRDHRLDALGFDSLDRFYLAVALEQTTGRAVPDLVLASAATLGDFIDHLTTATKGTP
ncbi:acyl carrier protein [Amycolatopsis sp. NPDC051102]|uniref:acyl carrier protein n=1 Tax=Amycolatopsis sp. NPDC051102 TaxID=3155163 RepID=UPI00343079F7